jgi:hypothetical protein
MRARGVIVVLVAASVTLSLLATLTGCSPDYMPPGTLATNQPANVTAELAYVDKYYKHRNVAKYGSLGGTDCVNFTSQALTARGWAMTKEWGHTLSGARNAYSSAWISSTAFMKYLGKHPELATAVSNTHRGQLVVGDLVQFDYDGSGDRDHTGIITRIIGTGDAATIEFAAHARSGYEFLSVDTNLAKHSSKAVAYFWHLNA